MSNDYIAGRNVAMGAVRVTEAAAIAASQWMGRGDEEGADKASAQAMAEALTDLAIDGKVVIGDSAFEALMAGEKVGNGNGPQVDIALMALEGPTIIAKGEPNGVSIVAMAEEGSFLPVPPVYMDKIAVGGGLPEGVIDLNESAIDNLGALADAKGLPVSDLVVCILDRPRHHKLIEEVREAGARISLISEGDLSGAIATLWPESGIDIYLGSGGAEQGVLAAAALRGVGGQMQGRLIITSKQDEAAIEAAGIKKSSKVYSQDEMAGGDITVAMTGITSGAVLTGVRTSHGASVTHSLVLRSKTGTLRSIEAYHNFAKMIDVGGY